MIQNKVCRTGEPPRFKMNQGQLCYFKIMHRHYEYIYVNEMFIKPIWGPDVWENHMQEKRILGRKSSGLMQSTVINACLFYERIISKHAHAGLVCADSLHKTVYINRSKTNLCVLNVHFKVNGYVMLLRKHFYSH